MINNNGKLNGKTSFIALNLLEDKRYTIPKKQCNTFQERNKTKNSALLTLQGMCVE